MTAKTPPRKANSAQVAASIPGQITSGTLAPGDRLPPERQLSVQYSVARGTVRHALNLLERQNLVETRAGSGTYVVGNTPTAANAVLTNTRPLELMDARFAIEPHCCRLAVLHGRQSDFDRLEDLCAVMEQSVDDPNAFSTADTEFHICLTESAHNGMLAWMMEQITLARSLDEWKQMRNLTLNESIIRTYNTQHRQVLTAIREREPERAAELMKRHLETARLTLTRAAQT